MTDRAGWTEDELAARLAADLPDGAVVNLGIGSPTRVAAHIAPEREIVLHSENGIVGMGPPPDPGQEDPDLIDAGKFPVTLAAGAAIVGHEESFMIIRGGRLGYAVLGAFQVAENGDLASWRLPQRGLGSVGGAMDLAAGARNVFVLMHHNDRSGAPKLVERCTYPLTAPRSVDRVYTELGVFAVTPLGFEVLELAPGVERLAVQEKTGARLGWQRVARAAV
jgi:3-oxoadipate CoA-transferase beta subunit